MAQTNTKTKPYKHSTAASSFFADDAELPASLEKVRLDFGWSQQVGDDNFVPGVYPPKLLARASSLRILTFGGAVKIPDNFELKSEKLGLLKFENQFNFKLPPTLLQNSPNVEEFTFGGRFNQTIPPKFFDNLTNLTRLNFISPHFQPKNLDVPETVSIIRPRN